MWLFYFIFSLDAVHADLLAVVALLLRRWCAEPKPQLKDNVQDDPDHEDGEPHAPRSHGGANGEHAKGDVGEGQQQGQPPCPPV